MPLTPPQPDGGILDHIKELWGLLLPLLGAISSLIVWAYKRIERSVDKVEQALNTHAASDEGIHDKLFSNQRSTDEKLNRLIGEHTARHEFPSRELTGHSLIGRSNEANRNP